MMMQARKWVLVWGWLAVAAAMVSCQTTHQTRGVSPVGFLGDYSQLRPGGDDEAQLIYIDPEADIAAYDKILFDPITMWVTADSSLSGVSADDLQMLADTLDAVVRQQLADDYAFVDRPGPDVMRLRVALTEARQSRVVLDLVSNVLPPMMAVSTMKRLAVGTHAFVGRASIEAEVLDSMTNRRLMAAVDQRAGRKVFRGKFETWNDVEEIFDYWAGRFRSRLAELRG